MISVQKIPPGLGKVKILLLSLSNSFSSYRLACTVQSRSQQGQSTSKDPSAAVSMGSLRMVVNTTVCPQTAQQLSSWQRSGTADVFLPVVPFRAH